MTITTDTGVDNELQTGYATPLRLDPEHNDTVVSDTMPPEQPPADDDRRRGDDRPPRPPRWKRILVFCIFALLFLLLGHTLLWESAREKHGEHR